MHLLRNAGNGTNQTLTLELRQRYPLASLLKVVNLARSTFYYQQKVLQAGDKYASLKVRIRTLFDQHKGRYGYRRITAAVRCQGDRINHKTIQRLMSVNRPGGRFTSAISSCPSDEKSSCWSWHWLDRLSNTFARRYAARENASFFFGLRAVLVEIFLFPIHVVDARAPTLNLVLPDGLNVRVGADFFVLGHKRHGELAGGRDNHPVSRVLVKFAR